MSQEKLLASEIISRVLLRLDDEECKLRSIRDEGDFVRRRKYGPSQIPEKGLSFFIRKHISSKNIYLRMSKKDKKGRPIPRHIGLSSCKFDELSKLGVQYLVEAEHLSIRCADCNMADLTGSSTCETKSNKSECPFFSGVDPIDFLSIFKNDEPPELRTFIDYL